jgi:hypothetical protein
VPRRAHDLVGEPRHLVHEGVAGDDARHEPERFGFFRLDDSAREAELTGNGAADEVVQRPVDDIAELDFGVREPGRVGGDAQVTHDREVETARDRWAVDRGDERERESENRRVEPIARGPQLIGQLGLLELA